MSTILSCDRVRENNSFYCNPVIALTRVIAGKQESGLSFPVENRNAFNGP